MPYSRPLCHVDKVYPVELSSEVQLILTDGEAAKLAVSLANAVGLIKDSRRQRVNIRLKKDGYVTVTIRR